METLIKICKDIINEKGLALVVGGYVRDLDLGISSKDIDVEVFYFSYEKLLTILKKYGNPKIVGKAFGVININIEGIDYDFSLPRKDSKIGIGHKGFSVETMSNLSLEEACLRRDLTINSIYYNPVTGNTIDPVGGVSDLRNKIARPVSKSFMEDPLRIMRLCQFIGRFQLTPTRNLKNLCKENVYSLLQLPKERINNELVKLLTKSEKPSLGFNFMLETGILEILFPDLWNLNFTNQDPKWHPEGNVWKHTMFVLDEAVRIGKENNLSEENLLVLTLAALCHDIGKFQTTTKDLKSPKHALVGSYITEELLSEFKFSNIVIKKVSLLVKEHMVHVGIDKVTNRIVRRLIHRISGVVSIKMLGYLIEADRSGRPPLPKGMPDVYQEIIEKSKTLPVEISPIIKGRHLLKLGWKPSPRMGVELKRLLQLQLDGKIPSLEEGLKLITNENK